MRMMNIYSVKKRYYKLKKNNLFVYIGETIIIIKKIDMILII